LIVVGASAGGIEAIIQICGQVPSNLRAAILVVLHTSPHSCGTLPHVFSHYCHLPVVYPEDGERIRNGRIYIAPPDFHMIVEDGILRTIAGPHENRHRPAIDPTFRSAAFTSAA
jgi:two-component system chemotaxis response regulator CheB